MNEYIGEVEQLSSELKQLRFGLTLSFEVLNLLDLAVRTVEAA